MQLVLSVLAWKSEALIENLFQYFLRFIKQKNIWSKPPRGIRWVLEIAEIMPNIRYGAHEKLKLQFLELSFVAALCSPTRVTFGFAT